VVRRRIMDIGFYVEHNGEHIEVGRMLCPVVPRIGETVYLRMSLAARGNATEWRLNPNDPVHHETAYFLVEDVAYDGYNVVDTEKDMGAAPYHQGSMVSAAWIRVSAKNEDTQIYIDRVVKANTSEQAS